MRASEEVMGGLRVERVWDGKDVSTILTSENSLKVIMAQTPNNRKLKLKSKIPTFKLSIQRTPISISFAKGKGSVS